MPAADATPMLQVRQPRLDAAASSGGTSGRTGGLVRHLGTITGWGLCSATPFAVHGAYDAIVLACATLAVPVPLLVLDRRTRDRIDRIAASRWIVLR